jgi:hypothetical protein
MPAGVTGNAAGVAITQQFEQRRAPAGFVSAVGVLRKPQRVGSLPRLPT